MIAVATVFGLCLLISMEWLGGIKKVTAVTENFRRVLLFSETVVEFGGVFVVVFIGVLVVAAGVTGGVGLIDKVFLIVFVAVEQMVRSVFLTAVVLLVGVVVSASVDTTGTFVVDFNIAVLVAVEFVIVLVIVFVAVIVFIIIVGIQLVREAIVFDIASCVVLGVLLALSEEGVIPTASVVGDFVLIFMEGLRVIIEVRVVVVNFTNIPYIEGDIGIAGTMTSVLEVFLLGVLNMSEMASGNIVVESLIKAVSGSSLIVLENVFLVLAAVLLVVKQDFVAAGLLDKFFPVVLELCRGVVE